MKDKIKILQDYRIKKAQNWVFIILLVCFLPASNHAQQGRSSYLDSLYNRFLYERGVLSGQAPELPSSPGESIKCGFSTTSEVVVNLQNFTQAQRDLLKIYLARPNLHTSIVSPSGFFRIHFDTTGINRPNYVPGLSPLQNARFAAEAFDSSFNFEVTHLGYPAPPNDNGAGNDNLYDVYLYKQGGGGYGFTEIESEIGAGTNKYISWIGIDSEFGQGYYTHGPDAMQATAAHELHHAIQMGNYIYRSNDLFLYELTSTALEEFVFDHVNDYYNYIRSYFDNTSRVFSKFQHGALFGYDLAIWNIFLADTLGIDILKRQWELMPQMPALDAIAASLIEAGTSFSEMMNEFGIWTYFTNYRAKQGMYFEEASEFPVTVRPMTIVDFNTASKSINISSPPAANTLITFVNKQPSFPDTLAVIISNADYKSAISNQNSLFSLEYILFNHSEPGAAKLVLDYHYKVVTDNPAYWSTAEMLNNELVRGGIIAEGKVDYAFPSPFYYNKHSHVFIPAEPDLFQGTDLNIYTSSMDLVYSSPAVVQKIYGQTVIRWNGMDNSGNKLASGVYIYAVKTGDDTSIGKIVIFNE